MSSLSDIIKKATKANINKASLASVRELEESSPGNYIAFVDDGLESYDIQIELQGDKVINTVCDCPQTRGLCWHRLAVLLQLANGYTEGTSKDNAVLPVKKRRRKITESETILQDLNHTAISEWLLEVFKKNKPLEQQFLLDFAQIQKEYTAAEVGIILNKSLDSVLKNRKKATAKEIKKVVDLLTQALSPIESFLWAHIQDPISFEIGETLIKTIDEFNNRTYSNSNRLETFIQQFLNKFALNINNIKDVKARSKIIAELFKPLADLSKDIESDFEFLLLREIYETSSEKNKEHLALDFQDLIEIYVKNKVRMKTTYNPFFLDVFIAHDLLEKIWTYFKPLRYENDYNLKLVQHLIDINPVYSHRYCTQILRYHLRKEQQKPYLDIMRSLE